MVCQLPAAHEAEARGVCYAINWLFRWVWRKFVLTQIASRCQVAEPIYLEHTFTTEFGSIISNCKSMLNSKAYMGDWGVTFIRRLGDKQIVWLIS
jgi:hypothetical protein